MTNAILIKNNISIYIFICDHIVLVAQAPETQHLRKGANP